MDGFWKIVEGWDTTTQVWVFLAFIFVVFLSVLNGFRLIRLMIVGYPQQNPKVQDCNHECNLTGKCLKAGTGCRTVDECNLTIGLYSQSEDKSEE